MQGAVAKVGGEFVLQDQARFFQTLVSVARVNRKADERPMIRKQLTGIEYLKVNDLVGGSLVATEQCLDAMLLGAEVKHLTDQRVTDGLTEGRLQWVICYGEDFTLIYVIAASEGNGLLVA